MEQHFVKLASTFFQLACSSSSPVCQVCRSSSDSPSEFILPVAASLAYQNSVTYLPYPAATPLIASQASHGRFRTESPGISPAPSSFKCMASKRLPDFKSRSHRSYTASAALVILPDVGIYSQIIRSHQLHIFHGLFQPYS